jgi:hypothetical protein
MIIHSLVCVGSGLSDAHSAANRALLHGVMEAEWQQKQTAQRTARFLKYDQERASRKEAKERQQKTKG